MERTISAVEATLVVGACMMMGFTAMVIERVAMEEASIVFRVGGVMRRSVREIRKKCHGNDAIIRNLNKTF